MCAAAVLPSPDAAPMRRAVYISRPAEALRPPVCRIRRGSGRGGQESKRSFNQRKQRNTPDPVLRGVCAFINRWRGNTVLMAACVPAGTRAAASVAERCRSNRYSVPFICHEEGVRPPNKTGHGEATGRHYWHGSFPHCRQHRRSCMRWFTAPQNGRRQQESSSAPRATARRRRGTPERCAQA